MRPRPGEILFLGLAGALLAFQLFIPPYIGLADNGDFARVCARFSLAPDAPGAFVYFTPDYNYSPRNYWKSDVWYAQVSLAAIPALLARPTGHFNIRYLGALHA